MDLKQYTHELIYEGKYIPLTDSLEQFRIVCPEYAPHEDKALSPSGVRAHLRTHMGDKSETRRLGNHPSIRAALYLLEGIHTGNENPDAFPRISRIILHN